MDELNEMNETMDIAEEVTDLVLPEIEPGSNNSSNLDKAKQIGLGLAVGYTAYRAIRWAAPKVAKVYKKLTSKGGKTENTPVENKVVEDTEATVDAEPVNEGETVEE